MVEIMIGVNREDIIDWVLKNTSSLPNIYYNNLFLNFYDY